MGFERAVLRIALYFVLAVSGLMICGFVAAGLPEWSRPIGSIITYCIALFTTYMVFFLSAIALARLNRTS